MERKRNTKPADGIWRRFRWFIFIPILVSFNEFFYCISCIFKKVIVSEMNLIHFFSKINNLLVQITFSYSCSSGTTRKIILQCSLKFRECAMLRRHIYNIYTNNICMQCRESANNASIFT